MNGWLWLIAALLLAGVELLVPGWAFMGLAASGGLMGVLLLAGLWTAGLPVTLVATALLSVVAWLVFRRLWPSSGAGRASGNATPADDGAGGGREGYLGNEEGAFHGAKLVLTHRGRLLTYLRDDRPGLPFPAHWDLPGGGREGNESPVECALRELDEEFGLALPPLGLEGRSFASRQHPGWRSWLFTGSLTAAEIAAIRLGDEGQDWRMMPLADFAAHPRAVPQFRDLVAGIIASSRRRAPADAARRP